MRIDFEAMARPGIVPPGLLARAEELMGSHGYCIAFEGIAACYDQSDKHHFSGSPISPAGDRWDNRRKVRRDGQHTLIV